MQWHKTNAAGYTKSIEKTNLRMTLNMKAPGMLRKSAIVPVL